MKSPDSLAKRFREADLKVTPQRIAVFEALNASPGHATADHIHRSVVEALPKVSLRTVYQILHELTEIGELVMLDLGTGAARFDHNLSPHHHLVCESCATVVDVPALAVDVRLSGVADMGVTVSGAELVMRGVCAECNSDQVRVPNNQQ